MSGKSNIEWTEVTWNPVTGCNKVSQGCKYCYAEKWANMQMKRGIEQYRDGFEMKLAKARLKEPHSWKNRKIVFVNSMSDLFHEKIPLSYLKKIFKVMNETERHTYQVLTKRSNYMMQVMDKLTWTKNIWLGVSVESNETAFRLNDLRNTPAQIKFVSFEPLLESVKNVNLGSIDWVIVGGESGGKARPIKEEWVTEIHSKCMKTKTPFFFKQWGKTDFNPDREDVTIPRENEFHARGGCSFKGKVYRQTPTV